jgi:hypothetical protein
LGRFWSSSELDFFGQLARQEAVLSFYHRLATEWQFMGLQRLLYTGLYDHKRGTSELCALLLVRMTTVVLDEVVEGSPARHALAVVAFLPWLYHKLVKVGVCGCFWIWIFIALVMRGGGCYVPRALVMCGGCRLHDVDVVQLTTLRSARS